MTILTIYVLSWIICFVGLNVLKITGKPCKYDWTHFLFFSFVPCLNTFTVVCLLIVLLKWLLLRLLIMFNKALNIHE